MNSAQQEKIFKLTTGEQSLACFDKAKLNFIVYLIYGFPDSSCFRESHCGKYSGSKLKN